MVLEMKRGRRPRAHDGVSLQAHRAAEELLLQHDRPGSRSRRHDRGAGVARASRPFLRHFLDFRLITSAAASNIDLEQLRSRIHILEGFEIIFNALDKAIKIIRESSGKPDAAEKLIKAFQAGRGAADAILESQLYKIAQMEIKKILDELKEKKAEAERIEAILASEKKLWGVIKNEMGELIEKFAERRRTRMASDEDVPDFRRGSLHRPREHQRRPHPQWPDQARGPPGFG